MAETLFHSGAGELALSSFHVGAFRGLRDVHLEHLSSINLLVGAGNSGKTSVLEALHCFANPIDIGAWATLVRSREVRTNALMSGSPIFDYLRWLFPHSENVDGSDDLHLPIRLKGRGSAPVESAQASCEFVKALRPAPKDPFDDDEEESGDAGVEEERFVEDEGWRFDLGAEISDELIPQSRSYTYWQRTHYDMPRPAGVGFRSTLLPPYAHRNQPMQVRGVSQAVEDDQKELLEELLRNLDPNILGIEIITDRRGVRPLVALRHREAGLAPISVFGDGIRRALMIALAVNQNRGGIILIDEIEAALHVSALNTFFPWLERACVQNSVQLFATTHSLEAIDAISGCADSDKLSAYHLGSGDDGHVKRYTGGMLQRLVHERGLDIR